MYVGHHPQGPYAPNNRNNQQQFFAVLLLPSSQKEEEEEGNGAEESKWPRLSRLKREFLGAHTIGKEDLEADS